MFRLTVRLIGFLLLAGAFASLVIDGTRSIAGGGLALTPLGQTIFLIFPEKFQGLQPAIEKYAHPLLWDPLMVSLLLLPTWLVVGLLGFLLMLVSQKKAEKIGYSIR
jgi:hypothetical protein